MQENIEDELGYGAPGSEKPFRAYQETQKWNGDWNVVPVKWKTKIKEIFGEYIKC
jgi:hypothetical protein